MNVCSPAARIEELENALCAAQNEESRLAALVELALALRTWNPARAGVIGQEACRLAEQHANKPALASALASCGLAFSRKSEYAQAEECLTKSLALSRDCGDLFLEADCLHVINQLHFRRGEYFQAIDYSHQALGIRREIGDTRGMSTSFHSIGVAYFQLGDYTSALPPALEALALREQIGDQIGLAASLTMLGNVYSARGDWPRSLEYHHQVVSLCREIGYCEGLMNGLTNSGSAYGKLKRYEAGLEACHEALALTREQGNCYVEAAALSNLGECLVGLERWDEALSAFQTGIALAERTSNPDIGCDLWNSLGDLHNQRGRIADARAAWEQAVRLSESCGAKATLAGIHGKLTHICEQQGDLAAALAHLRCHHTLQEELSGEEAERRVRSLLIQRDLEKAQKEAELHRLKNIEMAALLQQVQQLNEELEELAMQDGLTGLANRRYLEDWLARAFPNARRHNQPLTVALADLDHFKQINDRFSHLIGDDVLRVVARLLQKSCRTLDIAARYGGEEFVLVLSDTSASEARLVCERLRRAVENYDWSRLAPGLAVTLSFGLSDDPNAAHHDRLLALADANLYCAKHRGRNQICG